MKTMVATLMLIINLIATGTIYPLTTVVTVVDEPTNKVYYRDATESIWIKYDTEDWQDGDIAALIMYDNGTPDCKYDDVILYARYCGTVEDFVSIE